MNTININVTFSLPQGFSYSGNGVNPDGSIDVNEPSSLVYTLTNPGNLVFLTPALSANPTDAAPILSINNISFSNQGKTMTLTDVDSSTETICMQLKVLLPDGSVITSPDPKIRDTKPQ